MVQLHASVVLRRLQEIHYDIGLDRGVCGIHVAQHLGFCCTPQPLIARAGEIGSNLLRLVADQRTGRSVGLSTGIGVRSRNNIRRPPLRECPLWSYRLRGSSPEVKTYFGDVATSSAITAQVEDLVETEEVFLCQTDGASGPPRPTVLPGWGRFILPRPVGLAVHRHHRVVRRV
jgi:hypothetical protein